VETTTTTAVLPLPGEANPSSTPAESYESEGDASGPLLPLTIGGGVLLLAAVAAVWWFRRRRV
jgi:hypothetical protein